MGFTPTQRTLKLLKQQGYKAAVVEKWLSFARRKDGRSGVRKDLFNIIDILYLDKIRGVVGVQTTSGTGWSDHMQKLSVDYLENTLDWLSVPGACLELWAWRKLKGQGWQPRIHIFKYEELINPFA